MSRLCIRWPKYWSFSISLSDEYSGLISFRIDWFVILAVQGTLRSLLQHHSSKASVLQRSTFFMAQLSHAYMTSGKTIALTICTIVGKAMSLLFNTLSRFVIAFLPRRKCLLISWLQSPSPVILEPKKIKSLTVSTVCPSICHEVMEPDAMTKLDSVLKSRGMTLPKKVCLVKAIIFPVVIYGYESWTIKKAECWRIDAFELWCWRRLLKLSWTVRRSNHSILKEINPEYSLEGLMLKLKLQYFGHLI